MLHNALPVFPEPLAPFFACEQVLTSLRRPPNTLPLIGNGLHFLKPRHDLFSWFVTCERQFSFETFEISVPTLPPGVVINDPKNVEFVLKNESIFSKGAFFKRRSWDLFGNGIINVDGKAWKVQRKAGLEFLNKQNFDVLVDVELPRHLDSMMKKLDSSAEREETVDLDHLFLELTTQLMGRMAYSMEMHADDDFSQAFEYASGATGRRVQNPFWQLTELLTGGELRRSLRVVKSFGRQIVAQAISSRPSQESSQTTKGALSGTLIYSLLDAIPDPQLVADAALNYLSAGRDTTAQALTWTFYLLQRHPDVLAKLRSEIQNRGVGSEEGTNATALPYTTAVFYEALRLYPPVPIELKQVEQDVELPDGTFLPRSTIVVYCIWAMNRSATLWGGDASLFNPDRWLDGSGGVISKSAFEFPVFNGGPRMCLGKKMAECVAGTVIEGLVQRYEFGASEMGEKRSRESLTLPVDGGLGCWVRRLRKG